MQSHPPPEYNGLEVAIVGMVCRFPGARSIEQFWQNLREGVESISFFSDEELEAAGISPAVIRDPNYVKAKGVLEDIDLFDASFFGYSPREAEIIDPQQRLFLECAWEALESAGYNSETYKGLIGVYAGVGMNTYLANLYSNTDLIESVGGLQIGIGSDKDYLTTRVSYKLNLEGPSVVVQAACATSLVAVHLACQGLLSGECDMALASGVTLGVPQKTGHMYQNGGILSPDGHCRAFDAEAQGTVSGNGIGVVVLKRLDDALTDGDSIHAIIKGSAVNNDGATKVGYAAPRVEGQAKAGRAALRTAEVDPETVTYVEAHGTGTELGDPIELAALTRAFRTTTGKKNFCALGSVKTNIGHLDTASGVASLIKATLALEHKQIPPSLHFKEPNPRIDLANSPFYVNTTLSEWKTNGHPRRAGVHSYAIGGTNAHIILEEAPAGEPSESSRPCELLLLSAKTETALETATSNLVGHLQRHPELSLADVAFTLQVGRRLFNHRRMLVCRNLEDAVSALRIRDSQRVVTASSEFRERSVMFMFPSQMARKADEIADLYASEPVFREHIDRCAELLKPHLGIDLRDALVVGEAAEPVQKLEHTVIAEPVLFIIEYALAQLWMSWGVQPAAMIGDGLGEYVAACLAGVFSLEEALTLVAARGRLADRRPAGAMVAVSLPEQELSPLLGQSLSLAAVAEASLCVVSGPSEAVEALEQLLSRQGVNCSRLQNSAAFKPDASDNEHNPFAEQATRLDLKAPKIPFVSNVTGSWITDAEAIDPHYWARHLSQPGHFAEGLRELFKEPQAVLLEVGPGRTASILAKGHPEKKSEQVVLSTLGHQPLRATVAASLLDTLGRLTLAGVSVNWAGVQRGERHRRVPLPSYPFERQRHWVERRSTAFEQHEEPTALDRKPEIAEWFYVPSWKRTPMPASGDAGGLRDEKTCWLMFLDRGNFGVRFAQRLAQFGGEVITVETGERFAELGASHYSVNPQEMSDYDALFNKLIELDRVPDAVVHFWSVETDIQTSPAMNGLERAQQLGYFSLISLAQSLGSHILTRPVRLHVVSNNMQDVTGEEELLPEKATLLDPCRVIPLEYPNITCRSIDITLPESGTHREKKLVEQLATELAAATPETVVAYRGGHRWVRTFEPAPLAGEGGGRPRLRFNGVYLITGGLGRIGMELAEYLAQTLQAKLILTGRSACPERAAWEQWLATHYEGDAISQKIRKLQALEDIGAEVLTLSADVADEGQMREVVTAARERFGALHGVIHAAGMSGDPIASTGGATLEPDYGSHLNAKVFGPLVLAEVLRDNELDFCLLFSSLASVLGGRGFAPRRATEQFMDAFAHQQNRGGSTPWMSINWDAWQFEEQTNGTENRFALAPAEGIEVFRRVLSTENVSQIIVSTGELSERLREATAPDNTTSAYDQFAVRERLNAAHPFDLNGSDAEENLSPVERKMSEIWSEVLKVERIGLYVDFFQLGGQSILAIQIIQRINQAFQVNLPMRSIFKEPTIAGLSALVEETLIERLEAEAEPELDSRPGE